MHEVGPYDLVGVIVKYNPVASEKHAFVGLLTCGRCGCAYTAEIKKERYSYYRCTGYRGACNAYIREEELARLLGEVVKRVRIPTKLADKVAKALRESQADKEKFARTTIMRIPVHREHSFRFNVNTDSADAEQRFRPS